MNSRWLAYRLMLLGLMSLGFGCKGDGGGDAVTTLTVQQTSPTAGQTDVVVDTRIGFQIDAPIDPNTLTNDTFFVTDSEGTRVEGTLAIGDEPSIAALTPNEPLAVLTSFTATITTGLRSSNGAMLEEDFDWTFTTLDSAWGESEWLESIGTGTSSKPDIVVDAQRNAMAIWAYGESSGTSIWANRYTRIELWGAPEPIDAGTGLATDPQLAADAAGNGFAVWQDGSPGDARIWTNRYAVDQGWGTPELLQDGEVTRARTPSIAADPDGNAIAIWVQLDMVSNREVVWARRFEPGAGWGAAGAIDELPPSTFSAGQLTALGMDADGNAIALWTRPAAPPGDVIWANRYTPGAGWGTAEVINADEAGEDTDADSVRLDVGSAEDGDAFVTWVQKDEARTFTDVWATRFSGSTWGTPERINDPDSGNTTQPDIAVDGTGVAHAVWSQSDEDFRNIYASQYTPDSGWGTPELIEPPNPNPNEDADATVPRVEVNTVGNAFVVWRQNSEDWGSIWSNHLDPETGWIIMNAELIEDEERAAGSPKIVVDESRHAHAVWPHSAANGVNWVRTNRFE